MLLSLAAVIFVLPGYLWLFDGLIGMTTRRANFCSNHPDARPIEEDAGPAGELPVPTGRATGDGNDKTTDADRNPDGDQKGGNDEHHA